MVHDDKNWEYLAAEKSVCIIPDESVIIMALLHDLCKTHYYKTSTRNVKNEQTGKWEKAPFYTVEDKMPLGHGAKSAMLAMQFIKLTNTEMYAIWHHMGFTDQGADFGTVGKAMELHPAVLALHTADMMASRFMESESGNKEIFADMPAGQEAAESAAAPASGPPELHDADAPPEFEDGGCVRSPDCKGQKDLGTGPRAFAGAGQGNPHGPGGRGVSRLTKSTKMV